MAIFNSYVSLPEGMFKWWQLGKKTGYPFAKSKCQFRRENDDEPMELEGSFFLTNPYQLQEQWKFWREIMETTNQKQQFLEMILPDPPQSEAYFSSEVGQWGRENLQGFFQYSSFDGLSLPFA